MNGVEQPEIVQSVIVQVAYSGKSRVIDAIGAHQPQPEDAIELKVLDVAAQRLRRESLSALIFVAQRRGRTDTKQPSAPGHPIIGIAERDGELSVFDFIDAQRLVQLCLR